MLPWDETCPSCKRSSNPTQAWIKDLVHKLKWTYGALWRLNTAEGSRSRIGFDAVRRVAEWKDGWYNLDMSRSTRTHSGNNNIIREESRIEALFYSSYKSCSFQQGLGYVGLVLLKRQSTWLTGGQEILERAVRTQALFLKTAGIQTVMCIPWNNHVLELGKFEQESRNEHVLHQIQRWLSCVTNPSLSTQPSPGGVVSEDDSGGSREAMQMTPSIASSIFTDGSNVNVQFGAASSSDLLIKQQQGDNNRGTSSFSTSQISDARVQVSKRSSFVRYPRQSQAPHDAISLLRPNQEVLSQEVPSMTGHEKPSLEMGTTFAEDWGATATAGRSGVFQQVVVHDSDPIIPCTGMAIPGISSLLPADTFSQQHCQSHPRGSGGGGISLDQALLTSLPMTMPPDIPGSLPLPMDLLQEPTANPFGLPQNNSREWPALEPSKAQSLVQMIEKFTDDDSLQRLHSPDHALIQSAVASSSDTVGDWVGASTGTTPISHQHHHHYDQHTQQRQQHQQRRQQQQQRAVQQFDFSHIQNPIVNTLQNMSTPRPALTSLMTHQHQQQHHQLQQQAQHQPQLVPHGQQPQGSRWPIAFTTPTAWVLWVARKQATALRYKDRDPNGSSHAVLRVNQMVLKKLLTEMVPKIAKEQKAREEEGAVQAVETETSSHRVRMISYPTTTATRQESGNIQDPQARIHMLAERRRRVRENEHYSALRKLIPPTSRMDKATVLAETIQLVKRLRRRVRQLEKVHPDNSRTLNLSLVTSEDSQIGNTSHSSRGDPGGSTPAGAGSSEPEEGRHPGPNPDFAVPASAGPSQDDNKQIVEVNARPCAQNILRAKIRTFHRPDSVVNILTCLKDFGLEVLSTSIIIEKDWVHADFELKINAVHSSRIPQFTEELQVALGKAVFPAKSSADSTLEGRSFTQDS